MTTDHLSVRHPASDAIATLTPGYFALVMGTGIISVGMRNHRLTTFSDPLMWLTAFAYLLLATLTVARAARFPAARADFDDPRRGFRFFTFVAGTGVLGTRLALAGHRHTALALLAVAGVAWILLGYIAP